MGKLRESRTATTVVVYAVALSFRAMMIATGLALLEWGFDLSLGFWHSFAVFVGLTLIASSVSDLLYGTRRLITSSSVSDLLEEIQKRKRSEDERRP